MLTNYGEMGFGDVLTLKKLPGVSYWTKFAAGTVGTSTSTIFSAASTGELYTYLSSPEKVSVASTNVLDNSSGSGCRQIHLFGQDENFDDVDEIIEMNGQTPVESTYTYVRLYRMRNISLSSHDLLGQAYCGPSSTSWTAGEPDQVLLHIDSDFNQTQIGLYTVPKGFKLVIKTIAFNSHKDKEIEMWMAARSLTSVNEAENPVFTGRSNWGLYRNLATVNLEGAPLVLDSLTEFEVRGRVASTGTEQVFVNMNGYLVPEKYFG